MKTIHFKIRGLTPLLMHADVGLDPFHPLSVEIREITAKGTKKRTEQDQKRLAFLEWQQGLYWSEELRGPYIPARNLHTALRDGARLQRAGKDVVRYVIVEPDEIRLDYQPNGQESPLKLYAAGFHDLRGARTSGGGKVLRSRPLFNRWGMEVDVHYDEDHIKTESVRQSLAAAGKYCGIGDYRPYFGRFEVV